MLFKLALHAYTTIEICLLFCSRCSLKHNKMTQCLPTSRKTGLQWIVWPFFSLLLLAIVDTGKFPVSHCTRIGLPPSLAVMDT